MPSWAAIVASFCFAALVYAGGYRTGMQHIQTQWDAEKIAIQSAQHDKEQALQANMDKLREGKNREIARLTHTVRTLSDSLRSRPDRPDGAAKTAGAGDSAAGCTGAQLYRPDASFLVGEAERADRLRLALIQCQEAYRSVSEK